MHEIELNVAADHIDRRHHRDAYVFHSQAHNRDQARWAAVPPPLTNLTLDQVRALQWLEHDMGGERVESSACPTAGRLPSAASFDASSPIVKDELDVLLSVSFAEAIDPPHSRPYPSGGAVYSGQVTVFAKRIEGLEQGSYHYLPRSRQLERLHCADIEAVERSLFLTQADEFVGYAFFVLYSIMPSRSIAKYGMRGYRLACIEVGSMYQSLIQQSELRGLRSRVWGGFADEALSLSLGVDPRAAWPVVCHLVGKGTE